MDAPPPPREGGEKGPAANNEWLYAIEDILPAPPSVSSIFWLGILCRGEGSFHRKKRKPENFPTQN